MNLPAIWQETGLNENRWSSLWKRSSLPLIRSLDAFSVSCTLIRSATLSHSQTLSHCFRKHITSFSCNFHTSSHCGLSILNICVSYLFVFYFFHGLKNIERKIVSKNILKWPMMVSFYWFFLYKYLENIAFYLLRVYKGLKIYFDFETSYEKCNIRIFDSFGIVYILYCFNWQNCIKSRNLLLTNIK